MFVTAKVVNVFKSDEHNCTIIEYDDNEKEITDEEMKQKFCGEDDCVVSSLYKTAVCPKEITCNVGDIVEIFVSDHLEYKGRSAIVLHHINPKDKVTSAIDCVTDVDSSDIEIIRNCYKYRYTCCPICSSVIKIKRDSLKYRPHFEGEIASVNCPCCNKDFTLKRNCGEIK